MSERIRERVREPDPETKTPYDYFVERRNTFVERQFEGTVVVWPHDREWLLNKQGRTRHSLHPALYKDTCLQDWTAFVQEIPVRGTGKHRHQGGLVIFALEGEGTTTMDDVPYDWEAGDLVILPVKENGVVHQHFNRSDEHSAYWFAFINDFIMDHVSSDCVQIELSPEWLDQHGQG